MRRAGIVVGFVLALGCAPRGPAVGPEPVTESGDASSGEPAHAAGPDAEPDPAPRPDVAPDPGLLCLPVATCGCFHERECAAVRLRADGLTVDIVTGPRAGQTGNLLQHCLGDAAAPTDCVDYVDPAIVCRRPSATPWTSAKQACAAEDLRPDFSCGFEDGSCAVL